MDGQAVKEVERIIEANQVINTPELTYVKAGFHPMIFDPRPAPIKGNTLAGIVDYIMSNPEGIDLKECFIHVHSFKKVELVQKFTGKEFRRTYYYEAALDPEMKTFPFDLFMSTEEFAIKSRALFQWSEDLDLINSVTSKVTEQNSLSVQEDGLSQSVTVKKGVSGAMSEGVVTKGVYSLKPYRTFRDMDQVESDFILRFKAVEGKLPMVALFDAGGDSWRTNSTGQVVMELRVRLAAINIVIPIFS